jgi:hypothetical protein
MFFSQAMEIEDALNYDEPPDWFLSVRHYLGEVLVESGKPDQARSVYLEDLNNFPENGWALHGLMVASRELGDEEMMNEYNKRFFKAWEHGDIGLSVSEAL